MGCWKYIMPELPEAQTIASTLASKIENCSIISIDLLRQSALHEASLPLDTLKNGLVKRVGRRGKMIMVELLHHGVEIKGKSDILLFHLRMTGKLLTGELSDSPGKYARCVFKMENPEKRVFNLIFEDMRTFGKIIAGTREKLLDWPYWQSLGPEPLEMRVDDLYSRLKGGRPIKTALLDQQVLAGIGNIYADESLFRARINPLRRAGEITKDESSNLMEAIQFILKKAIAKGGSSIRDYVDANGKKGNFQNSFSVYGRGGHNCIHCGNILKKIQIGGRATVYCPVCQK